LFKTLKKNTESASKLARFLPQNLLKTAKKSAPKPPKMEEKPLLGVVDSLRASALLDESIEKLSFLAVLGLQGAAAGWVLLVEK
jgi:hypothetical protein